MVYLLRCPDTVPFTALQEPVSSALDNTFQFVCAGVDSSKKSVAASEEEVLQLALSIASPPF